MTVKISPSILSADFAKLGEEVKAVTEAGADYIHIDVMDGIFVPNITIGPSVVKSIRPHSDLTFDTHLMIEDPEKYIEAFANAGSDIITFHQEAVEDVGTVIDLIHSFGKKAGVSIKPKTPASVLDGIYDKIDLILVMTVEPGFGGQKFIDDQLTKVKEIRKRIDESGRDIDLEVDGGINAETAELVKNAGANVLVAGNYVFKEGSYGDNIASLKN